MGLDIKTGLIDNIDLCRLLGVKPDTWRKRVSVGTAPLPFSQMGNRTYYRISDVRYFLRKGQWPERLKFRNRERADVPLDLPELGLEPEGD
jgi:hypothetical protein